MLYVIFMILAIAYNIKKFRKEREVFLSSIIEAKGSAHREMILGHSFYIFIFEGFLALIVAHLVTERAMAIGILGLGAVYLALLFVGFYLYQFFIRYVEKHTNLELYDSFKSHLIQELRVNFAMILLPILVYSLINWAFLDSVYDEWGGLWFIGLLFNIIFVSVLTLVCSVILMLRLIPNREIIESEYLEIINKRRIQIGQPNLRVRWIETDIKNAFIVGLKLLSFSNQTMFIGKALRNTLTLEEFDAVIAHELSHVANRHVHKRVIDLMKNFISVLLGIGFIMLTVIGTATLFWGEDAYLYSSTTTSFCVLLSLGWLVLNYALLFDTIRSHEFEADAYAVMELGASLPAMKSALEKLANPNPEEIPEYIRIRTRNKSQKNVVTSWISKFFSTHPDLQLRVSFLEHKISTGLPFDYYVSTTQKIKTWFGHMLNWKVAVPLSIVMIASFTWLTINFISGQEMIAFINRSSNEEILKNQQIKDHINYRPPLTGYNLMYFVVKKKEPVLIDHFLKHGAAKGKTLIYISSLKDTELFNKYYSQFKNDLSDEEYVLVLRRTAQLNFTEAYRMLVNAKQFEALAPHYKQELVKVHKLDSSNRKPASVEPK